jgi:hypothetical protein
MPYKVLVDDLTVNRDGPEITDLFGNVIGYQSISAIHRKGAVLDDDQVGEAMRQSVDDGETEGFLEKAGSGDAEEANRLGEPLPGYDDLEVEQVQALFKVVPSATIRAIVEYEASDEGQQRAGIVDYHIGRAEAFSDRLTGRAGSPSQDGAEKPSLESIQTREVGEDDVVFGLGPNDDGQPQVELDESRASEGESVKEAAKGSSRSARRGSRAQKPASVDDKKKAEEKSSSDKSS